MFDKNKFFLFFLFSFFIHMFFIFYLNPTFFLFSNIQNIKIKKDITKVKLIKIKPKPVIKKEIKKNTESVNKKAKKIETKKNNNKKDLKLKEKVKLVKKKKKIKKKKIIKKKIEKLDLSSIHKKIFLIKKREKEKEELKKRLKAEKKRKEKLKQEAAVFYSNKIVSLIQSLWVLPKGIDDSELSNLEIKVKLKVNKKGKIIGMPIILNESDNKYFNESALRAIEKLNNYTIPLPKIIDEDYLDIIITLVPPNM